MEKHHLKGSVTVAESELQLELTSRINNSKTSIPMRSRHCFRAAPTPFQPPSVAPPNLTRRPGMISILSTEMTLSPESHTEKKKKKKPKKKKYTLTNTKTQLLCASTLNWRGRKCCFVESFGAPAGVDGYGRWLDRCFRLGKEFCPELVDANKSSRGCVAGGCKEASERGISASGEFTLRKFWRSYLGRKGSQRKGWRCQFCEMKASIF